MTGAKVTTEVTSLSIFRGQRITIYLQDADPDCAGERMEAVEVSVSEEGKFKLKKTDNLEVEKW